MKIAIVVHGRFHAFNLARALIQRGNQVMLFTNYPGWAVEHFGVARRHVRSFWPHGVATRLALQAQHRARIPLPEPLLHQIFARWVAAQLRRERWDVVHCWSGVSEEVLHTLAGTGTRRFMMRGSAHIRVQDRLLAEEEQRTGVKLERPSPWMIAREEREYALADRIVVLSSFAYNSFLSEGIPAERLALVPLGADLQMFRPTPDVVAARCRRILSGEPLRLIYTGNLTLQKGVQDLAAIAAKLDRSCFQLRLIGSITPEVTGLLPELRRHAELLARQPEHTLPQAYAWSDLFLFTTIQDGYAAVLAQAQASALPILTTTNCAGPDIIHNHENGWVLPIRSPEAFIERLQWCHNHRQELAAMVQATYNTFQPRDWNQVALDFESATTTTNPLARLPV